MKFINTCPVCNGKNEQVFDAPDIDDFIHNNSMCYMCKHDSDGYTVIFDSKRLDKTVDNLNQTCLWFSQYRDDALSHNFNDDNERDRVLYEQAQRLIKQATRFIDELKKGRLVRP